MDVSTGNHGSLGFPGVGGTTISPLVPSDYISLLGNPGTFITVYQVPLLPLE